MELSERGGWTQNSGGGRGYSQSPANALGAYVPPNSIEAEQSTLGAMLIERAAIEKAREIIGREDFYRETHQTLFDVITALADRLEPVDLVTVIEELKNRDKLDAIGGIGYLTSLFETVPTAANVEYYAKIVQEKSILRRLIAAGLEVIGMARGEIEDIHETIAEARKALASVEAPRSKGMLVHVKEPLMLAFDEAETRSQMPASALMGVSTGFTNVNKRTGGWQNTDLIILGARPSIGKTSLARAFALGAALKQGITTAFFTAEMSALQVATQLVCSTAGVDYNGYRAGSLSQTGWDNIVTWNGKIAEAPLYLRDKLPMSIDDLLADLCVLEQEQGKIGLVIVDYLQLIRPPKGRADNRTQEVGQVSRGLKEAARRFGCPVIALSQLSRAVELRQNKRPMLSDLRESGDIEADADVVAFLYRQAYYDQQGGAEFDPDKLQEVELIFSKQRMGSTGIEKLGFTPRFARFSAWDTRATAAVV